MVFYQISALINAITSTIVLFVVLIKNPKSNLNRSCGYFTFSVAIWAYCYFFWQISRDSYNALFWCRALMAGAIFIPPAFFHFSTTLIGSYKKYFKKIIFWYMISIIFILFDFTPFFVKKVTPQLYFPYWPMAGIMYLPFLIVFIGLVIYSHVLMYKSYKEFSGIKRNQIKYVFWGTAVGFLGGATNYPLWYGIKIPPYGNILVSVYVGLIAYAIIKYRLMDIRIAITRAGIFLVVYTFVLGIPFWIGYQTKTWAIPTSLAIILATIGPIVYRAIQKKAEGILLAKQKHYQKVLLDAAKGMALEHNLNRLLNLIVHVVKRAVKIEYAAIFIEEKERQRYCLRVVRDHHKVVDTFMIANTHVLIEIIRKKREAIRYEDIPKAERNILGLPMHLVVPSMIKERLLGFLVLGEKEDRTIYTEDDVGVFDVLSRQAALAIEHCIFLEEFRKAQEKLFQAEKLASIGGMADGVAHQIRNRLNSFAVAVGEQIYELKDFKERKAEFIEQNQDLKNTIEYVNKAAEHIDKEVQRTAKIIDGILNYARVEEKEIFFSEFSFKEIVENAVNLVSIKHQVAEIPVEVEIDKGGDIIYGVKAQVMESIYNIIDNAYEAIVEKERNNLSEGDRSAFKAFIRVKFSVRLNRSYIEIEDNGIGVKEENKAKIFAPFFTTKSSYISGTGIGMYVVKRMIEENHNGKIWFSSEYKKGTTFYIELPRKKAGK